MTDSALTEHGALQIGRLAGHFRTQGLQFSKIFSSDLQRARMTAEALRPVSKHGEDATSNEPAKTFVMLEALREKNFGSLEGQSWIQHTKAARDLGYGDQESQGSMETRAKAFLNENILPLLADDSTEEETVAVVSHGIILSVLWRCLSALFSPQAIHTAAGVDKIGSTPAWSNTGYLELTILPLPVNKPSHTLASNPTQPPSSTTAYALPGWQMKILTVNGQHHVSTLKRTRGGVGSSRHDKQQKQIDSFFVKPKAGDH